MSRRYTLRIDALSVFGILIFTIAIASGQSPDTDASAIIASMRAALGGETRLAGVKTFVISGRTRQVQGDNLVPIEFELSCELPDKCVRRDEVPARESGLTTSGFTGDALIQLPAPPSGAALPGAPPGRGGAPPQASSPALNRINTVKQDFARWWLGMFAASFSSYPVTFTRAGQAEAPQGQADVLDVKGPANFAARLFVLKDSHLPIMLSWEGPPQGKPPLAASGKPAEGSQPKPIEYRLYYADYRDVDGLKLPFRLRRAVGADTTEETNVDRYRINTRIDARKFATQ